MHESPFKVPEDERDQDDLQEAIKRYLKKNIHDIEPSAAGRGEALAQVSGAAFGAKDVTIDRCFPKVLVDLIRLERGKSTVLIGPNGGGKSTIFDAIMDTGAELNTNLERGAYSYGDSVHGKDTLRISRLNQDEMLSGLDTFNAREVLDAMQEHISNEFPIDWEDGEAFDRNMLNQETLQRITELRGRLETLFEFDDFINRPVGSLSGGERTKLALCNVFLSEPDVLLLDEPTNHLDLESIAKLSEIIRLYNKAGASVLSVSHVNSYLREAGTGGVIEIQMTESERHAHASSAPYDRYMKDRTRRSFTIIEGDITWPNRRPRSGGALAMGKMERVTVPHSPLVNVSIPSLLPQDVWVLSGSNGTGKTKLLDELAGEGEGRIFTSPKGVNMAYLPQFWPEEVAEGTVEAFFNWVKQRVDRFNFQATSAKFVETIKSIGFRSAKSEATNKGKPFLQRPLASFSGGEQRLMWFLAVSCFPTVDALLLDEPTNHLDQQLQKTITKAIRDFPGTIVFSTHDLQLLDAITESVGNKGSTMAPKNIVLTKKNGKTEVEVSSQNPAAYMRSKLLGAKKSANNAMRGRV